MLFSLWNHKANSNPIVSSLGAPLELTAERFIRWTLLRSFPRVNVSLPSPPSPLPTDPQDLLMCSLPKGNDLLSAGTNDTIAEKSAAAGG
ncbi:hypothetical protein J6590_066294 [Homalodisca vitripennis]|nr:hypothetical protein J6590_066294 [Homalodisca vitripennis]